MWLQRVGERQKRRSKTRKGAGVLLGPARPSWVAPATALPWTKFVVVTLSLSLIQRTPAALVALLPSTLFPFLPERILKREIWPQTTL